MWIVYKTTNILNGKIYIGVHGGDNPRYLGSGSGIKRAVRKYGRKAFKREVLFTFDTAEEAYSKEAELVTEEFIRGPLTYNLRTGGKGGQGGLMVSEETRAKMRAAKASGFVPWNKGVPRTPEDRAKVSAGRLRNGSAKGRRNPKAQKVIFESICFYTVQDAAAHFGVNRITINRWRKMGKCFSPPK